MNPAPKPPDKSVYSGRFAARLRMLREKAGLTVEQLASALNQNAYYVTNKTIYNWESALRQPPIDAFPPLAKALGLSSIRALLPEK